MTTKEFFDNPFEFLRKYGRAKTQLFIFSHILAMKAKLADLPFLAILITDTLAKYNAMFAKTKDKTSKTGQRIAETAEVAISLDNFIKVARKVEKRAADKVDIDSVIYKELFNGGMSFYNHINMKNAFLRMNILKDCVAKYTVELGADLQPLVDNAVAEFEAIRTEQMTLAWSVKDNNPAYDKKLTEMIKQLNVNRCTICIENGDNPEDNYIFFEDAILHTPKHRKGTEYKGPWVIGIDALSQEDSKIAFALGQKIVIKNLSEKNLYYFGALTGDELMSPSCLYIKPGEQITITAEQLGCPDNKFLILGNKDALEMVVAKIYIK